MRLVDNLVFNHKYIHHVGTLAEYDALLSSKVFEEVHVGGISPLPATTDIALTPGDTYTMKYEPTEDIIYWYGLDITWGTGIGFLWSDVTKTINGVERTLRGGNLWPKNVVLTLPSVSDGYRLLHIDDFTNGLKKLTVINSFDDSNILSAANAFNGCTKLTRVNLTFPNLVDATGIFQDCKILESPTITSHNVEIWDRAFMNRANQNKPISLVLDLNGYDFSNAISAVECFNNSVVNDVISFAKATDLTNCYKQTFIGVSNPETHIFNLTFPSLCTSIGEVYIEYLHLTIPTYTDCIIDFNHINLTCTYFTVKNFNNNIIRNYKILNSENITFNKLEFNSTDFPLTKLKIGGSRCLRGNLDVYTKASFTLDISESTGYYANMDLFRDLSLCRYDATNKVESDVENPQIGTDFLNKFNLIIDPTKKYIELLAYRKYKFISASIINKFANNEGVQLGLFYLSNVLEIEEGDYTGFFYNWFSYNKLDFTGKNVTFRANNNIEDGKYNAFFQMFYNSLNMITSPIMVPYFNESNLMADQISNYHIIKDCVSFSYCPLLRTIRGTINTYRTDVNFTECPELVDIPFHIISGTNLNLRWSPNLSLLTILNIIDALQRGMALFLKFISSSELNVIKLTINKAVFDRMPADILTTLQDKTKFILTTYVDA